MMVQGFAGSLIALFASLILQSIASLPIHFCIAPIILLMYAGTSSFCLWAAFLSGLYLDCITGSPRLGFIGVSMLVAIRMLYPWRLYFFKDSISTLPIMTYLYASLCALMQCFIVLILDLAPSVMSLRLCISEIAMMPFLDVIWAVGAFMIVPQITKQIWRPRNA